VKRGIDFSVPGLERHSWRPDFNTGALAAHQPMNENLEPDRPHIDHDEEREVESLVSYIRTLRQENAALRDRCALLETLGILTAA